jgi:hypothetical protein
MLEENPCKWILQFNTWRWPWKWILGVSSLLLSMGVVYLYRIASRIRDVRIFFCEECICLLCEPHWNAHKNSDSYHIDGTIS